MIPGGRHSSGTATWTIRRDGSNLTAITQFTDGQTNAFAGSFSPHGKQIVFRLEEGDTYTLAVADVDGGNLRRLTTGRRSRGSSTGGPMHEQKLSRAAVWARLAAGQTGHDRPRRKERNMQRSRRPLAIAALAVAAVATVTMLVAVGIGAAAPAVLNTHENFTDSFPDSTCGIDGTSIVRGVDNFTLYADNTFKDNFEVNQTFTATGTGKSILFHVAEQVTGNDQPIDNGDGTITFVNTFKGLPEQVRLPNGRVLTRDAGVVTFTILVDAETDEFISQTVSGEKGPHPDLDSDFAIFCDVVVPALS